MNSKHEMTVRKIIGAVIAVFFIASVAILIINRVWGETDLFSWQNTSISVFSSNVKWKYMKEGKDPSVGNVWTTPRYDASWWNQADGSFGTDKKDKPDNLLDRKDSSGENINSYFFRYEFEIEEEQLDDVHSIVGTIEYKDAVIVYLNGEVIFAGHIPEGGYESNLEAGAADPTGRINTYKFQATRTDALREGVNVLSVETHKAQSTSGDVYFAFPEFRFKAEEIKEQSYDTKNLMLEQGKEEDELAVNWLTDSDDFYILQYIETSKYKYTDSFSKYGKSVFMERQRIKDREQYVNRACLTKLKQDKEYVYRVLRIGSEKGSKIYSFQTAPGYRFSFGTLSSKALSKGKNTKDFQGKELLSFASQPELKPDIITVIGELFDMTAKDGVYPILQEQIWKTIPTLYNDGIKRENAYLPYQNAVLIDVNCKDLSSIRRYIDHIINDKPYSWVIIIARGQITQEIAAALDADLVIHEDQLGKIHIWTSGNLCSCEYARITVQGKHLTIEIYDLSQKEPIETMTLES